MSTKFSSGKRALAECDRCGFRFKLRDLKYTVERGKITHLKVCKQCWEPDHPQNDLGRFPVYDPQAVRDPRPDFAGYAESRAQVVEMPSFANYVFVGYVTVTTT